MSRVGICYEKAGVDCMRILLFLYLFLSSAGSEQTISWWGDLKQSMIDLAVEVIMKLPESPIVAGLEAAGDTPILDWLPMINWFVPFRTLLAILSVWLTAISVYYLFQIVLRWLKVIE